MDAILLSRGGVELRRVFVAKLMRGAAFVIATSTLSAFACERSPSSPTPPGTQAADRGSTFKVATWNIRSGMGIRGFATTSWSHDTLNCTDHSQPVNAWGIGLPQAELERIRADHTIVAVAIQEAWNCAFPVNINAVLGFKTASRQEEGVMLLARHGFLGPIKYHRIDVPSNRWIVGGTVCLDASCTATMPMFSTHFGSANEDDVPAQAQRALDFLKTERHPHVLMGDLNIYRIDTWNPPARCTGSDVAARVRAIDVIEAAGYTDAWKATQASEGWTGMASRRGCGTPDGNLFKRIDYVYTTARVVSTSRFGRADPGADSPSDHIGVIAEIAIP